MKKKIVIKKKGDVQIGIRIPEHTYKKILQTADRHNTSIQMIINFILSEEIENYD